MTIIGTKTYAKRQRGQAGRDSDMVFELFWLLDYQFSPRLADAGEASFWRIDPNADYSTLYSLTFAAWNTWIAQAQCTVY